MNGIETLNYLNKKYANNGVKFEDTGTAIKITDEKNVIYLNENPKNEREADYLVKLNVQCLTDGISENGQLQKKFAFNENEAIKYIENFRCADFGKRFSADVDGASVADGYFGYTATFIDSRNHDYYVTLYDIDTNNELAKELVKFDELFDRITQNKKIKVEGDGTFVNIFFEDNVEYEVNLLREKADEVEKQLKDKLNIK